MKLLVSTDIEREKSLVKAAIEDCIKWPFPEKNVDRLTGCLAHDDSFFIFHPDSKSTCKSYTDFKKMIDDIFMDEALRPTKTDIRDMRIHLSRSGEVAWFNCLLDDFGEYGDKTWAWENARWTGVLEKRDGKWLIVQMHFSLPTDR